MSLKILIPLFFILYAFVLLINLTGLPLYLDEGIYIFWAYLLSQDPGHAYASMQDGKTPLFVWLVSWVNPILNNYILTGRFISVIASSVSLACWSFIAFKVSGKKSLPFLFLLFLIAPYNVLISRMAFVDSLLVCFCSLSLTGLFLLRENLLKQKLIKSFILAVAVGLFLGLAFLTKTTAKIFLAAELVLIGFWAIKLFVEKKVRTAILLLISAALITGIYFELIGYLRFGAQKHWEMIAGKEAVLIFTLPDIYRKFVLEQDYTTHIKNVAISAEYFLIYFGPILLLLLAGTYRILKTGKDFWILIFTAILSIGVLLSARVPASRYFAIIVPEILFISATGLLWVWQKNSRILRITVFFILIIPLFLSSNIIFDPLNAYYARDDQANFVSHNLNALGLEESAEYLKERKAHSAVAVTGIWGVAEGALVRFQENGIETYPTSRVVTIDPLDKGCQKGFREFENNCYKVDFGSVMQSQKEEKYIYFINEIIDIEILKKLENIEVIRGFTRPESGLKVYLLKINP